MIKFNILFLFFLIKSFLFKIFSYIIIFIILQYFEFMIQYSINSHLIQYEILKST